MRKPGAEFLLELLYGGADCLPSHCAHRAWLAASTASVVQIVEDLRFGRHRLVEAMRRHCPPDDGASEAARAVMRAVDAWAAAGGGGGAARAALDVDRQAVAVPTSLPEHAAHQLVHIPFCVMPGGCAGMALAHIRAWRRACGLFAGPSGSDVLRAGFTCDEVLEAAAAAERRR